MTITLPNSLSPIIKQIYACRGVESAKQLDLNVANLQGLSRCYEGNEAMHLKG